MVTVIPESSNAKTLALGQSISNLLTGINETYEKNADEKALQNAVAKLGPQASGEDIMQAILNTKTYGKESKQKLFENVMGVEKFKEEKRQADLKHTKEQEKLKKERADADAIIDQLELPEDQAQGLKGVVDLKTAQGLLKEKLKPPKAAALSPAEKKIQELSATHYVKTKTETLPELRDLRSTLGEVEKISSELSTSRGLSSYVFPSAKASELKALATTLIKPVLKVFNPVGQIPIAKIQWISDQFKVEPTESASTREGKIKASKYLLDQAYARAGDEVRLYEEYGGAPPQAVIDKFHKETEGIIDAIIDTVQEAKSTVTPSKKAKPSFEEFGL
jgi:hypothetical protein